MDTTVETIEPSGGAIPADTFGHRLMLARAHAGHISIRVAADLCELGRGAWTNWERGARPEDKIEVADVVAAKLGVDRDWLLFGGPLVKEERRSTRVLRRNRKEGAATQPNVFYLATPERTVHATDRVVGAQPTPASQGSPRLPSVRNPRPASRTADPRRTAAAPEQRRTQRRHRPAS